MRSIVFVFLALLSLAAFAEPVVITGNGSISCGKWMKAYRADNELQIELYREWVAGYLSAYKLDPIVKTIFRSN
jgi:hypothetical protein